MFKKMLSNVNFKQKFASIALLVTLLVSQFSVFGDADRDKVLEVGNYYVWFSDSSIGKTSGMTKFKLGGKEAYCADYKYHTPSAVVPTFVKKLSNEATAVLVNGYPNVSASKLGCNSNDEARIATQLALWNVVGIKGETQSNIKLKFNNLSATNGHGDDFNRALAAAKKLASKALSNPYNANPSIKINASKADVKVQGKEYVAGPYYADVKDMTVGKYEVKYTKAPSSAYIVNESGSKTNSIATGKAFYLRWSTKEQGQTIRYEVSASGQISYAALYKTGKEGQQEIAVEEKKDVNVKDAGEFGYCTQKGALEVLKVDQYSAPIAGVVFDLKNSAGTVVATKTTDNSGKVTFTDLDNGTYTVVEKSVPAGYIMSKDAKQATVSIGETAKITVVNNKIEGKLKIVKTDDTKAPLAGVTFEILDTNKNVVDTITTDVSGIATSKTLAVGKYYYRETAVPENIVLDSEAHEFEIAATGSQTVNTVVKNIVNIRKKGGLKIVKVDDQNLPIAGVTFDILNSNKEVIQTITTDENGLAATKELTAGTYYYQEKTAPKGVIVDNTVYEFKVDAGQIVEKKIINVREKGSLKIVKVDENNKKLAGVVFEILNAKKEVVETITTNEIGEATTSYLATGKYYYRETKAPEGVVVDKAEKEFTLTANNKTEIKVVNKLVKGSLKIVKVDDQKNKIAGVTFVVKDANGKKVAEVVTDKDGIAKVENLLPGKYTYEETKAPEGYVMETGSKEFTIEKCGKEVCVTVVNKIARGKLQIIKVDDSENPLPGVTFEILNKNKEVIATLVTDEKGVTNSAELELGTYYYRETKAPEGVQVDSTVREFTIVKDGQVVIAKIVNHIIKGKLKIVKVNDANEAIEGVSFEIKDASGKVVETITTNKDGIAESGILQYGKYTYKETKAPSNVVMDEKEYSFEIKEMNKILVKKVINNRKLGNFEIVKTDDNKQPLAGVTFEILDENKKVVDTVVTDKDGKAKVENLLVGKYYYRESKVPANIVLDSKLYPFEMTGETVTKEIENKIIKGSLKIVKTDDYTKQPLAGVKFEIYDEDKKVVDTVVTDEKGIATSKELAYGKYTYKEVEVPDGIVIDSDEYPFEVTEDGKVIEKEIVNIRIKGHLEILKLDADTKAPIAGVKFEVLDKDGNVIETIVTDANGKAVSSVLLKGTYSFKEVEAPSTYEMNSKEVKFKITENNQVVEETVYNKAKTLPKTGGLGTNTLIFLVVSMISTLGFITFKRNKKEEE